MKILKKYWMYFIPIIIILIVLLIFVLFFSIPRVKYEYDSKSNTYLVKTVYGNASTYKISETIDGKDVTTIGTRAFYNKNIESIIFENTPKVETVKRLAFSECKNLKTIDLSTVKYFENSAFSYCESLKLEELNAESIGMSAFYGCKSITDLKLNVGLTSIGSYAFSKTSITTLDIPSTVKFIYNDAFADMDNLTTLNIYSKSLNDVSKEYLASIENVTINYL